MWQCRKRVQITSKVRPLHLLRHASFPSFVRRLTAGLLGVTVVALATLPSVAAVGVQAERSHVIEGAFGFEFGKEPGAELTGATLDGSPIPIVLYNIVAGIDRKVPMLPPDLRIQSIGWRHFEPSVLSARLRSSGMRFFVLQTEIGQVAMIAALLPGPCEELASFLAQSIAHKYQQNAEVVARGDLSTSTDVTQRWTIGSRHIALTCGDMGYLVYADSSRIEQWRESVQVQNDETIERDRLGLLAEANRLLPGHGNNLPGAFGLLFDVPVRDHKSLPIAQKFVYDRVRLAPPFDKGTFELVLAESGNPVRITGEFKGIKFDRVSEALEARFGMPFKARPNHVQYNINGDYLSLHRVDGMTRIAVVHTKADKANRIRAEERAGQTPTELQVSESQGD